MGTDTLADVVEALCRFQTKALPDVEGSLRGMLQIATSTVFQLGLKFRASVFVSALSGLGRILLVSRFSQNLHPLYLITPITYLMAPASPPPPQVMSDHPGLPSVNIPYPDVSS